MDKGQSRLSAWYGRLPTGLRRQVTPILADVINAAAGTRSKRGPGWAITEVARRLAESGAVELAIGLFGEAVDQSDEPKDTYWACCLAVDLAWQQGYRSAQETRAQGLAGSWGGHLEAFAQVGINAFLAGAIEPERCTHCQPLERLMTLYQLMDRRRDALRVLKLFGEGYSAVHEVAHYRHAFGDAYEWASAVKAYQNAAGKKMSFKAAVEGARSTGAIPAGADASVELLQMIARNQRQPMPQ